jgi:hypothetical protein
VPADGTTAATVTNGDFGTSPFFEQLSDKPQLACVGLCGESGVKHNAGAQRIRLLFLAPRRSAGRRGNRRRCAAPGKSQGRFHSVPFAPTAPQPSALVTLTTATRPRASGQGRGRRGPGGWPEWSISPSKILCEGMSGGGPWQVVRYVETLRRAVCSCPAHASSYLS